jgi:hypothetical protein
LDAIRIRHCFVETESVRIRSCLVDEWSVEIDQRESWVGDETRKVADGRSFDVVRTVVTARDEAFRRRDGTAGTAKLTWRRYRAVRRRR